MQLSSDSPLNPEPDSSNNPDPEFHERALRGQSDPRPFDDLSFEQIKQLDSNALSRVIDSARLEPEFKLPFAEMIRTFCEDPDAAFNTFRENVVLAFSQLLQKDRQEGILLSPRNTFHLLHFSEYAVNGLTDNPEALVPQGLNNLLAELAEYVAVLDEDRATLGHRGESLTYEDIERERFINMWGDIYTIAMDQLMQGLSIRSFNPTDELKEISRNLLTRQLAWVDSNDLSPEKEEWHVQVEVWCDVLSFASMAGDERHLPQIKRLAENLLCWEVLMQDDKEMEKDLARGANSEDDKENRATAIEYCVPESLRALRFCQRDCSNEDLWKYCLVNSTTGSPIGQIAMLGLAETDAEATEAFLSKMLTSLVSKKCTRSGRNSRMDTLEQYLAIPGTFETLESVLSNESQYAIDPLVRPRVITIFEKRLDSHRRAEREEATSSNGHVLDKERAVLEKPTQKWGKFSSERARKAIEKILS